MTNSLSSSDDGLVLTAELARLKLEDYGAVDFDQIVAIEPDAAEIIVAFGGGLAFERMAHLPDEIAIILARHDALTFPALATFDGLSDEALSALGSMPSAYRAFNGVTHITPQQLQLLAAGNGFLELGGLTNLSDELLAILAEHTGSLRLNGLRTLTAMQASKLLGTSSASRAHIDLDGLESLDEETAAVFGATAGTSFSLNGIEEISPRVAAHLARISGELHLGGLSTLSPELATILSSHAGTGLLIDGMQTVSTPAAAALARHVGTLTIFWESNEERSLSAEAYHSLLPHRGAIVVDAISAPPLGPLTAMLARRSSESNRMDGTNEEDLIGLGNEGAFSTGPGWGGEPIQLTLSGDDEIRVAPQFLALAHHLQQGAVTTLTPRELLGWFGAQRRGKKVVDRIRTTIAAFQREGFDALEAVSVLLDADDLDLVHTFPALAPVTGALADALRAPMTRLGYHIVDGEGDVVRLQSALATGRRRMLTIERIAEDPLILRAEVTVALPGAAATLALAIATVNRLNRAASVGRHRVDLVERTYQFDVVGAVRGLSDIETADGPLGVLPRLLSYAEAADLMLHRLLLEEPVHDPPQRSIEGVDYAHSASELTAKLNQCGVAVDGANVRVTTATVLGARPFDPGESDEAPRVVPETIGIVMRASTEAELAKIYLVRDEQEIESVYCGLGIIVTDASLLETVGDWLQDHMHRLTTATRQYLIEQGVAPQFNSVDEVLASLESSEEDYEDESEWDDSFEDDEEGEDEEGWEEPSGVSDDEFVVGPLPMRDVSAPAHPRLEEVRRLLAEETPDGVRQGLALLSALDDRTLWAEVGAGIGIRRSGLIEIPKASEINRTIALAALRDEAAMLALRGAGAFDGVERLTLRSWNLEHLDAVAGIPTLRQLELNFCPKLARLDALRGVPNLEALAVNYCAAFPDATQVGALAPTVIVRFGAAAFFDDLNTEGPLFQRLAALGMIRRAFGRPTMRHLQERFTVSQALVSKGWVLPLRPDDPRVMEAERLEVFVVDVHHNRLDGYVDESASMAVEDLIECFPPLAKFRTGHFFDFLFIDTAHRLVVGFGMGRKCRSFSHVSVDGEGFAHIDSEADEALDAQLAYLPFNLLRLMSQEFNRLASTIEDESSMPSQDELDQILEDGPDDDGLYINPQSDEGVPREEIEEQIARLEALAEEIEDSGEVFKVLFPNLNLGELYTYDF